MHILDGMLLARLLTIMQASIFDNLSDNSRTEPQFKTMATTASKVLVPF